MIAGKLKVKEVSTKAAVGITYNTIYNKTSSLFTKLLALLAATGKAATLVRLANIELVKNEVG